MVQTGIFSDEWLVRYTAIDLLTGRNYERMNIQMDEQMNGKTKTIYPSA